LPKGLIKGGINYMKKLIKRAAAVSMASMMVVSSLTACGSSKSNSSSATTADGKAVISMMLPSFYGTDLKNDRSDEVVQKFQDYTNTQVNFQWENNGAYAEKLGLTLMDRDNMPMILTLTGSSTISANVVDAAKKGAFWDLTSYLKDAAAYPNLSKNIPEVSSALKVDGQLIGIYRSRALGRYGFSYRKDWAEKVGITEDPKTIEDVYNMMYKFTYNDPDGDGKNDTYGLEMTKYTGPLDIIQTWFGCGNSWTIQNGKMVAVNQTQEYKDALKWIRKMYQDGLIRKDWATIDSGTFGDGCKKGEDGIFIDVMDGAKRVQDYFDTNKVPSVVDSSKTASMQLVGPVNNKTLATSGYNGFYAITKAGAKTEQDVKNCLHFLDKMCDDQMMVLGDYGLEGMTYQLNSSNEIQKIGTLEAKDTPHQGLNQVIAYIPNQYPSNPSVAMTASLKAQLDSQARNEKVAVLNPALQYLSNSDVNAEVGTDIAQILDDARTQYVCGQIDDAGLNAALQQWADRGGTKLVEDVNRLYQQDKTK
jgi:putative aldouronate transport system substrate-binding protein